MRLIDADRLKSMYSINQGNFNTVVGIQKWIDNAPTVQAVPIEVLDKIRAEIEVNKKGFPPSSDYYKAITRAVNIIDKYRAESEE